VIKPPSKIILRFYLIGLKILEIEYRIYSLRWGSPLNVILFPAKLSPGFCHNYDGSSSPFHSPVPHRRPRPSASPWTAAGQQPAAQGPLPSLLLHIPRRRAALLSMSPRSSTRRATGIQSLCPYSRSIVSSSRFR